MRKKSTKATLLLAALSMFPAGDIFAAKGALPGGGKHNTKTPIEVTSDALEVQQTENKAVFNGHVVAIQGDVRLTADKMTVFYASAEDKKKDEAKKPKKTAKGEKDSSESAQGAIKKIVPEGNVFLATPQETASGASGVYDVERQEIHLNDHVILTRGKNTLKGDKLVYNFATGKSVISSGNQMAADGKGKERVRALFVPEDKKPEDKKSPSKKKTQESDDKDENNQ